MQATGAVPELKKALQDTEPQVVLAAARSLLQLKDDATAYEVYYAVLTGKRKSGADLLAQQKKMLTDPKKLAQIGVETGIGFIPFGGLGMYAYKAFTNDQAAQVRAAAAKVLAKDPDPRSGDALVDAASDKSWVVRAAALDAIAQRDDRSLAEKIVPELDDDKPVVQYLAAAAIIRLNTAPLPTATKHSTRARKPPNQ
jgi:HEAT repeat protein